MKTERRHELQTNVLADTLGRWIVAVKPYTTVIVGAIAVAIIAVVAWGLLTQRAAAKQEQAWDEFNVAREVYLRTKSRGGTDMEMVKAIGEIEAVIEDNKDTPVGYWAELMLGNHYLGKGVGELFSNRERARKTFAKAVTHYTQATESDEQELKQRAYFGLGQAREGEGELDDAIKAYDAVVSTWPEGPLSESAKQYSERLKKPATEEFYAWYEKQDPQGARLEDAADPLKGIIDRDSDAFDPIKTPGLGDDPKSPKKDDDLDTGPLLPKDDDPLDDGDKESLPDDPGKDGDDSKLPDDPGKGEDDPKLPEDSDKADEPKLPDDPDLGDSETLPDEPEKKVEEPKEPAE